MAMTPEGMADEIYAEMETVYEGISGAEGEMKKYIKVFTTGIIKYLKSNMDVIPGSFANSGGNVTGKGKVE
jgi:hypothetical protein